MSEEVKNEENNSKQKWLWLLLLLLLIIFVVIAIVVFLKDDGTAEATDNISQETSQEQVKNDDKPDEKTGISSNEKTQKLVVTAANTQLASAIATTGTTSTPTEKTPVVVNVSDNSYFNEAVVLEITGEDFTATITDSNGKVSNYEGKATLSEDGKYTLTIKDSDGTEKTVSFTIDTTNPSITGVENGKLYNTEVTPIIEELNIDKIVLTKDGSETEYNSGDAITEDGEYILEVTDKAGNSASISFAIDITAPTYTIKYSTEKVTNKDVVVTITASEVIYGHTGWDKAENDSTITKTFTENSKENVTFSDKAGNTVTVNIKIENIDKVAPTATNITYSTEQLTNGNVIVTITASEPLYSHPGWSKGNRAYKIKKTFTENGEETVILKDKAGNETPITVKITNIDRVAPTLTVKSNSVGKDPSYSVINFKLTDNRLVDKFEVNGIMKDIVDSQWGDANYDVLRNLVVEGENTIILYDVAGNTTEYKFKMDWTAPVVANVEYSTTELTNGNVVVTITTSEPVYGHSGWSKGNRAYKITKTFTENAEETVVVTDRAGNKLEIPVKITNIDKVAPTPSKIEYSTKQLTNGNVKVTITATEPLYGHPGWSKGKAYVISKTFTQNTEETVILKDKVGNENPITISVTNIDKEAPVVTVESIFEPVYDADGNMIDVKGGQRLIANEDVEIVNEPALVSVNGSSREYEIVYSLFNPTHTGYHFINVTVRDRAGNETTTDIEIYIPEYPTSSASTTSNLNSTSLKMTKAAPKTAAVQTNTTPAVIEQEDNNDKSDDLLQNDLLATDEKKDDTNVIPTDPIVDDIKDDQEIIETDLIPEDKKETIQAEPVVDNGQKDNQKDIPTEPIVETPVVEEPKTEATPAPVEEVEEIVATESEVLDPVIAE